jgi:hypothetical protein
MTVRNFWIEASIDGKNTLLSGGPQNKNGGFYMNIKQRSNGDITKALVIDGKEKNGKLVLSIWDDNGKLIHTFETER